MAIVTPPRVLLDEGRAVGEVPRGRGFPGLGPGGVGAGGVRRGGGAFSLSGRTLTLVVLAVGVGTGDEGFAVDGSLPAKV